MAITIITLKLLLHTDGFKFNMIYLALQIQKDTRFDLCALTQQYLAHWDVRERATEPQAGGCATRLQLSTHNLFPGHCGERAPTLG